MEMGADVAAIHTLCMPSKFSVLRLPLSGETLPFVLFGPEANRVSGFHFFFSLVQLLFSLQLILVLFYHVLIP